MLRHYSMAYRALYHIEPEILQSGRWYKVNGKSFTLEALKRRAIEMEAEVLQQEINLRPDND